MCSNGSIASPRIAGDPQKELTASMTVFAPAAAEAPTTPHDMPRAAAVAEEKATKTPVRKSGGRKTKTLELTLTVTGTADGEWRAELKQGNAYVARDLAVAAAAVSRAAKELHEDLSGPIDEVIEEARSQQTARVAALEAELESARRALADLD
ncbi:hypothetical protein TUM20985_20170 [Mycobacterium antarcticum]|nr:hypothetical protein TUM20985_20170 [Mycolicibacterium sp. TUM20985]GLP80617.1 hypothetical protein TUM20984_20370 [Mycolicibacterium sp. TUM20984]